MSAKRKPTPSHERIADEKKGSLCFNLPTRLTIETAEAVLADLKALTAYAFITVR
jgi:hypothetical protein